MPWCTKCKSEYREKFTVCPRCGCELVKAAPLHRMEQRSDFVSGSAGPGDNLGLRKSCAAAVKPWQKENFGCHFTVWVTLFLGSLGMAGISLCIFGVISLECEDSYLFYGVASAVFILFIISGFMSLKKALIFEKRSRSQNFLRSTMLKWCGQNLQAEELDRHIGADSASSEEILYSKRCENIKARINYAFVNVDQKFLEKFVADSVYDMIYGGKGDKKT